jgi:hypothetical protein
MQTSRSGWATARVKDAESGGQESVAAWSAVRGWQETARSATRSGYRKPVTDVPRPVRPVPADQETLALESTPPEPKPKLTAVPERPRPQRQGQGKKTGQKRKPGAKA